MPRKEKLNKNKFVSREVNKEIQKRTFKKNNTGSGVGCTEKFEPLAGFISAKCEKVISNANSFIVLGRDRPSGRLSGYGGLGATGAHSIDLVAGRRAPGAPKDQEVYVNPNFIVDAARIYIAEKTDVDENFRITSNNSPNAIGRSAIALKADAVRIMADDSGIKLITRVNNRNSNGKLINRSLGVDLIGGNDDSDLQSMVKGENLVSFLNVLIKQISDTNGLVMQMAKSLIVYEAGILTALGAPWPGNATIATVPTVQKMLDDTGVLLKGITQKISMSSNTINYLTSIGYRDILSSYHRVN
tara:strand:+ start:558 stop:1460 length:903 start_codon:yes stop_codon:yes gene_type:complete